MKVIKILDPVGNFVHGIQFRDHNDEYLFTVACGSELIAEEKIDKFNSALSQHVQSELSSKIKQLKEKFSDEWIENEYGLHTISGIVARMMRDTLLNKLTEK